MPVALSRRKLFEAAGAALVGAALVSRTSDAPASARETIKNETVVRTWYKLWGGSRDWGPFDAILADDFTFSSTNGEDHISKAEFKRQCWDPNINVTKGIDLELVMTKGDEVFVKYLGHTTGGKTFRNVELHRVRSGRIASIECYFGGKATFPSAVESRTD